MERKPLIEKNAKEYVKKLKTMHKICLGESTISATKAMFIILIQHIH